MVPLLAVLSKPFTSTAVILSAILNAILGSGRRSDGCALKRAPSGGTFSALVAHLTSIFSLQGHLGSHFLPKTQFLPQFSTMVANY